MLESLHQHTGMPSGKVWLCAAAVAGMLWLFQKLKRSFWLFSILVLPGTFCHELCHYGIGSLLKGRPSRFTVLPRRDGRTWTLGAVDFTNLRWYNAFFIGAAPLLLLPIACAILWCAGQRLTFGWGAGLLCYLVANLAYGALPSWQDCRIAARSPVGWLLLLLGLGFAWMKLGNQEPECLRHAPARGVK